MTWWAVLTVPQGASDPAPVVAGDRGAAARAPWPSLTLLATPACQAPLAAADEWGRRAPGGGGAGRTGCGADPADVVWGVEFQVAGPIRIASLRREEAQCNLRLHERRRTSASASYPGALSAVRSSPQRDDPGLALFHLARSTNLQTNRRAIPTFTALALIVLANPGDVQAQARVGEGAGLAARFYERAVVGSADGRDQVAFGEVVDVRSIDDGSFLVLDRLLPGFHRFDLDGTHLPGWEARGRGPGELLEPRAIATISNRIVVVDPPNARHSWYRLEGNNVYFERSGRSVSSDDSSVCSLNGRTFIRGPRDGFMIHELNQAGELLRSFDRMVEGDDAGFGAASAGVRAQRNRGHLLCIEDEDLIVVAFTYLPTLRAYSSSGTLRWEARVAGFRELAFLPSGAQGVRFEAPEDGFHLGQGLSRWSPHSIVV